MQSDTPPSVALLERFLNTHGTDERDEALGTPAQLSGWLRDAGLPAGRPTERDVERVRELREALRSLLMANSGGPLEPEALEALRRAGRDAPLHIAFGDDGIARAEPAGSGVAGAIGRLLSAVERTQAEGHWPRMKVCQADDCRWAFYDKSRNRSRHWCDMAICGNRAKARAYRARTG